MSITKRKTHPKQKTARELAQTLRQQIRDGRWPVGQRLPSLRQLAAELETSVPTVQRALSELEAVNLIKSEPRRRSVVLTTQPPRSTNSKPAQRLVAMVAPYNRLPGDLASNPNSADSWIQRINLSIHNTLGDHRIGLVLPHVEADQPPSDSLLERIDELGQSVAGVVGFQMSELQPLIDGLQRRGLPWVSINRPRATVMHNFVGSDFVESGRLIARVFSRLGYRRIALLFGQPKQISSAAETIGGFMEATITEKGDTASVHFEPIKDSGFDDGYDAMMRWLKKYDKPDGVFAAGDRVAIGAMRALREKGMNVPQDVGVVGNTGLELAAHVYPTLTVMQQPMHEIGQAAARMLLDMMDRKVNEVPGRLFTPQLVVRESLIVPDNLLNELQQVPSGAHA